MANCHAFEYSQLPFEKSYPYLHMYYLQNKLYCQTLSVLCKYMQINYIRSESVLMISYSF